MLTCLLFPATNGRATVSLPVYPTRLATARNIKFKLRYNLYISNQ